MPIQLTENLFWRRGRGSSLRIGLTAMLAIAASLSGLLVVANDAHATAEQLRQLCELFCESNHLVVAAADGQAPRLPAVFARELFPEILRLPDEESEESLFRRHDGHRVLLSELGAASSPQAPEPQA